MADKRMRSQGCAWHCIPSPQCLIRFTLHPDPSAHVLTGFQLRLSPMLGLWELGFKNVPRMVALRRCLLRFTTAQGLAAQLADCAGSELRQGKGLARGGTIGGGDDNTRGF
jgi:hypothetical protein